MIREEESEGGGGGKMRSGRRRWKLHDVGHGQWKVLAPWRGKTVFSHHLSEKRGREFGEMDERVEVVVDSIDCSQ
jgi:hypothetical protein